MNPHPRMSVTAVFKTSVSCVTAVPPVVSKVAEAAPAGVSDRGACVRTHAVNRDGAGAHGGKRPSAHHARRNKRVPASLPVRMGAPAARHRSAHRCGRLPGPFVLRSGSARDPQYPPLYGRSGTAVVSPPSVRSRRRSASNSSTTWCGVCKRDPLTMIPLIPPPLLHHAVRWQRVCVVATVMW